MKHAAMMYRIVLCLTGCIFLSTAASGQQWTSSDPANPDTAPISRTGSVGIGTSAPAQKFHIFGSGSLYAYIQSSTDNQAALKLSTASYNWTAGIHGGAAGAFKISNSVSLGTNDYLTILTSGFIGIGTAAPAAKVDIDSGSATANELRLGTGVSGGNGGENKISFALGSGNVRLAQISSAKNSGNDLVSLHFRTIDGQYNLQDRLTIDPFGSLGIGTSTPAAKVDIDSGSATSNELRLGTGVSGDNGGANTISFALGTGGSRLAQISSAKNAGNDLVSLHFRTIDGQYSLQDRLIIDQFGSVGIGTSTPGAKLDVGAGATARGGYTNLLLGPGPVVSSQSRPQLELYTQSASAAMSYNGSILSIYTGGGIAWVEALDIDNAGNAHVAGNLSASGSLTVSGSITGASVIGAVYQDVAEWVPASGNVPAGTVVVLNREKSNAVIPSARPGLSLVTRTFTLPVVAIFAFEAPSVPRMTPGFGDTTPATAGS